MTDPEPKMKKRIKGVGQLAAGVAVAAVGVPMMVLPGPGAAAIAGGAVLAARGFENATGKKPPVDVDAAVFAASGKVRDITDEHVMPAVESTLVTAGSMATKGVAAAGSAVAAGLSASSDVVAQSGKMAEKIGKAIEQSRQKNDVDSQYRK